MGHAPPRSPKEPRPPPLTRHEYERTLETAGPKPPQRVMILPAGMEVRQLSGGYVPRGGSQRTASDSSPGWAAEQQQLRVRYQEDYTGLGPQRRVSPARRAALTFAAGLAVAFSLAFALRALDAPEWLESAYSGLAAIAVVVATEVAHARAQPKRPLERDPTARLRARYAAMDDPDWAEFEREVEAALRHERQRSRLPYPVLPSPMEPRRW